MQHIWIESRRHNASFPSFRLGFANTMLQLLFFYLYSSVFYRCLYHEIQRIHCEMKRVCWPFCWQKPSHLFFSLVFACLSFSLLLLLIFFSFFFGVPVCAAFIFFGHFLCLFSSIIYSLRQEFAGSRGDKERPISHIM